MGVIIDPCPNLKAVLANFWVKEIVVINFIDICGFTD